MAAKSELAKQNAVTRSREWRAANPERAKEQNRRAYLNRQEERKASQRLYHMMRRYKLTEQQAQVAMVDQQGGMCAYCGEFARLMVDHNHTTGAARGMICPRCNQIAGAIEDPKFPKVQAALAQ